MGMNGRVGWSPPWVRTADGAHLLETFLVWAVVVIVGTRVYLELAGYPRLGGGGLHIAHMLWGGLLMLAAIIVLVGFLGRPARFAGAVIGGFGFGLFIDELGKFVTSDNNYFYQPTMSMIYILFIVLFLLFRAFDRRGRLSPAERLANAADLIPVVVLGRATDVDIARALALIAPHPGAEPNPVADGIRAALLAARAAPAREPIPPVRLLNTAHALYERGLRWRGFRVLMFAVFAVNAVVAVLLVATIVWMGPSRVWNPAATTLPQEIVLVASAVSAVLSLAGVTQFALSRLRAYRLFRLSVLVTVFFTQVFVFFDQQLAGLVDLALNLMLLAGLNFAIAEEQALVRPPVVVDPTGR